MNMAQNPQGKNMGGKSARRASGQGGRVAGKSDMQSGMPVHMRKGRRPGQPGGQSNRAGA